MPRRAARHCKHPQGCRQLVRNREGYCPAHIDAYKAAMWARIDAKRPTASARGYGGSWPALRAAQLRASPSCRCGAQAVDVDHIVALRDGGTHAPGNLRSLCHGCHSARTAQDQGIAAGRGR